MPLDHYTNLSDYTKLIQDIKKIQSTESNKWIDTVTNADSIIQYPVEMLFQKNEQSAFQIIDGKAIYDIVLPKNCDYIDSIRSVQQHGTDNNCSYQVLCNNEILQSWTDRFVLAACPYTEIKIRLFFERDQIPENFGITYIGNIFSDVNIHKLLSYSNFDLDRVKYRNGCILTDPRMV